MGKGFSQYLREEWERRRERRPRYSLRAYARDLRIDPTALSRLLKNERAPTAATAARLLDALAVPVSVRESLLKSLVAPEEHGVPTDADYQALDEAAMEHLDDWRYFAALELGRSQRWDAGEFAARIGTSRGAMEQKLQKLVKLGLMRNVEGCFRTVHARLTVPYQPQSRALRAVKRGYLERALQVEEGPDNHLSGTTFLADRKKLREASRRITEFQRSLAKYLSAPGGTDLYRLSIELFPLLEG